MKTTSAQIEKDIIINISKEEEKPMTSQETVGGKTEQYPAYNNKEDTVGGKTPEQYPAYNNKEDACKPNSSEQREEPKKSFEEMLPMIEEMAAKVNKMYAIVCPEEVSQEPVRVQNEEEMQLKTLSEKIEKILNK